MRRSARYLQVVSHIMACCWMLLAIVHIENFDDFNATWLATANISLEDDSLASRYIQGAPRRSPMAQHVGAAANAACGGEALG